jgi:hypothetical protein
MSRQESAESNIPKANVSFPLATDPQLDGAHRIGLASSFVRPSRTSEDKSEATLYERRWQDVTRPYAQEDVERLRGSFRIEYTLAREGAKRLWNLLKTEPPVTALGALSGNQAVQQVRAGLKAIYLSGWQVAADANLSEQMYPDQSLYAANSVPALPERTLTRRLSLLTISIRGISRFSPANAAVRDFSGCAPGSIKQSRAR